MSMIRVRILAHRGVRIPAATAVLRARLNAMTALATQAAFAA
jgi:hypothetical protein